MFSVPGSRRVAVEPDVRHGLAHPLPQPVAQARHALGLLGHVARSELDGLAKPHNAGHVLGSRSPPPLVVAAVLDGHHAGALADVEGTDALGSVDLVRGHRHEGEPRFARGQGELAEGLDPVRVERDAPLRRDAPDLLDRHQRAGLAVRRLDRDQDRVGTQRVPHVVRVHQPLAVDRQIRHGVTGLLQRLAGAQERMVLDHGGDDVSARPRARNTLDRQVVRLCAAGGEHDLVRRDAEKARDALAGNVDALTSLPPEAVYARRISEPLREVRQHRRQNLRMHRRRCVVVEIDASHGVPHLVTRPACHGATAREGSTR
jgi:hypothetical protein